MDELLRIDIYNLDSECSRFATDLSRIADEASMSIAIRDGEKKRLEEVYSTIFLRKADSADKKPSDKVLEAMTKNSTSYAQAYDEYIKAKLDADLKSNRKEAMIRKGYMLDLLARLYLSEHYSDIAIKDFRMKSMGSNVMDKKVQEEQASVERELPKRRRS